MKTEISIDITPEQLAEMFIGWGSDKQAKFFNLVGKCFHDYDFNAESQICYIEIENDIDKHFYVCKLFKCPWDAFNIA